MFKYNELSDLLDGTLVTPLRIQDENVICLDEKGNEVVCSFDDFDYNKTIEERSFIVDDGEITAPDQPLQEAPEQPIQDPTLPEEPGQLSPEEPLPEEPLPEEPKPIKSCGSWIENNGEKEAILKCFAKSIKDFTSVNVYAEDII